MEHYEDLLKRVGQNINRLRQERGLSYQELAHQCDIEKSYLIKMCNEGKNITLKTLHRIAASLDVAVEVLFKK